MFPLGTYYLFCLHTSQKPTVARTHPWREYFSSPGAVAIINYLLFCQSSIWKLFWGQGFLQLFVWPDGSRAPLGKWLCWCPSGDFKERRVAQQRPAGPRTQKWTQVTNTRRWHWSGLGQRLGVLKTRKAAEPRVNIAIELSHKVAEKCGQDMMQQMKLWHGGLLWSGGGSKTR